MCTFIRFTNNYWECIIYPGTVLFACNMLENKTDKVPGVLVQEGRSVCEDGGDQTVKKINKTTRSNHRVLCTQEQNDKPESDFMTATDGWSWSLGGDS